MSRACPDVRLPLRRAALAALVAGSLAGTLTITAPAIAADDATDDGAGKKDAFVCMEETQEKCDYENENISIFMKAHDAFDRGRETGDLSEAHGYAAKLIERGDLKHASLLLRYIYWQVGQGVHKNLVQGYRWVTTDIAEGRTKYGRLDLQLILRKLEALMTPEQLAEARK